MATPQKEPTKWPGRRFFGAIFGAVIGAVTRPFCDIVAAYRAGKEKYGTGYGILRGFGALVWKALVIPTAFSMVQGAIHGAGLGAEYGFTRIHKIPEYTTAWEKAARLDGGFGSSFTYFGWGGGPGFGGGGGDLGLIGLVVYGALFLGTLGVAFADFPKDSDVKKIEGIMTGNPTPKDSRPSEPQQQQQTRSAQPQPGSEREMPSPSRTQTQERTAGHGPAADYGRTGELDRSRDFAHTSPSTPRTKDQKILIAELQSSFQMLPAERRCVIDTSAGDSQTKIVGVGPQSNPLVAALSSPDFLAKNPFLSLNMGSASKEDAARMVKEFVEVCKVRGFNCNQINLSLTVGGEVIPNVISRVQAASQAMARARQDQRSQGQEVEDSPTGPVRYAASTPMSPITRQPVTQSPLQEEQQQRLTNPEPHQTHRAP